MAKPRATGQECALHPISGKRLGFKAYEESGGTSCVSKFAVIKTKSPRQLERLNVRLAILCHEITTDFHTRFRERSEGALPGMRDTPFIGFSRKIHSRRHADGDYWLVELSTSSFLGRVFHPDLKLTEEDLDALREKLSDATKAARRVSITPVK